MADLDLDWGYPCRSPIVLQFDTDCSLFSFVPRYVNALQAVVSILFFFWGGGYLEANWHSLTFLAPVFLLEGAIAS